MLMIWSSLAGNGSLEPVGLCFFGRSAPSMHHKIIVRGQRESTNEIAGFGGLNLPIPATSNAHLSEKQTPAQPLRALFTDDYKPGQGCGTMKAPKVPTASSAARRRKIQRGTIVDIVVVEIDEKASLDALTVLGVGIGVSIVES